MGYEVDFLPVGNGDTSGDAITVRWGMPGNYQVMVYDGGTRDSGAAIVGHVKRHYQTTRVDYVVSSHPDADHASGLAVVLENLHVGELWMHRPWEYSPLIRGYFEDGRMTDSSLAGRLKERLRAAHYLEQVARRHAIPVREPFQDMQVGPFWVLSPQREWYVHGLIPAFEKSPESRSAPTIPARSALGDVILQTLRDMRSLCFEHWSVESLREQVTTTAENESSVILLGVFESRGVLLTGDAGVQALHRAATFAEVNGVDLPSLLRFIQVPHHGSRNNVSSRVLDRIVGERKAVDDGHCTKWAFVSAGKGATSHPRKMVMNAFLRRGVRTYATKGVALNHSDQMPTRGWVSANPFEFSSVVEPWD